MSPSTASRSFAGSRRRAAAGRENRRWGDLRIVGECRKLGVAVSATSVRSILPRRLCPGPRRGPSWAEFLRGQAVGTIACDFLTIETIAGAEQDAQYHHCLPLKRGGENALVVKMQSLS